MDTIGRSRWYWGASAENFRRTESTAILGQLVVQHHFDVGSRQRDAWLYLPVGRVRLPHCHSKRQHRACDCEHQHTVGCFHLVRCVASDPSTGHKTGIVSLSWRSV